MKQRTREGGARGDFLGRIGRRRENILYHYEIFHIFSCFILLSVQNT